ncbi:MAG: hypothetical protein U5K72_05360 [Balneolaceae bacterium]|nr:hypothetical protein [Balneolaceae bacterium]
MPDYKDDSDTHQPIRIRCRIESFHAHIASKLIDGVSSGIPNVASSEGSVSINGQSF